MIWRRLGGALGTLLLAIATIGYGYGVAGWVGALIAVNRDWRAPDAGTIVYVEDNGIHTGIVLPKAVLPPSLANRLRPEHLADPEYARHRYVVFGWGDRAFYLGTPTWADLDLRTVAWAAIGSDRTVVHVEHVARPRGAEGVRMLQLRPIELARLVRFIEASFADGAGPPVAGYGVYDAFYPATGRYSAVATCNEWTGRALRHAGVTIGAWTPFSGGVMRWLEPMPMD